jgi:hypothetical protein
MQSGISRLAPPEPESQLQSLPPILRNTCQVPIPSCSKGPRGLSVLPRVTSIFTRSAISPSPQLRQCPSRYAIRAGRNFASSSVTRGADYAFISASSREPAYCSTHRLASSAGCRASPRRDQSLRGHTPPGISRSRGLPTASPAGCRLLLVKAAGEGFAVMSGSSHGIAPVQGNYSPDKEFRSSHSPGRPGGRTISSTLTSMRVGWRMASEDSRNRDGFRWFMVCCTNAILRSPTSERCRRRSIMDRISLNVKKSSHLAVTSGFASKNGTIR